ncbi:MAG: TIR domain-containing protein [Prevotella sp.]|jgi:DNA-binding CsgD family transcriptional regulator|nr:TIR domain-containing protein [Prevotella sp.]
MKKYNKVFIGHAEEDTDIGIDLYEFLEKNGYKPWLDKKELLTGQDWDHEIKKALREADFIVFLLSAISVTKRGYVQREYGLALQYCEEKLDSDIYIIPCKINECDVPDKLAKYQWVELLNDHENGFKAILKSLNHQRKKYLGTEEKIDKIQNIADKVDKAPKSKDQANRLDTILKWLRPKQKMQLEEVGNQIDMLNELAKKYEYEKESFRNILLQHFDILKKAALLEGYLKDDERKQGEKLLKRFNEIVYNQDSFNWDQIYELMDSLYNNFVTKLRETYPQLDESEVRICCLTKAELNNSEIALIMRFSVNTIQSKKSGIRKKLDILDYGNIIDFIDSHV